MIEETPATREKPGGRVVVLLLGGLLLLAGGLYVAAYYAAGDKVPRGTTVAGVPIGGQTKAGAIRTLQAGLTDRVDRPIDVISGDHTGSVTPKQAGLSVDYASSVAEAGAERSWDPQWLWSYFTGGDDLEAVLNVDGTAQEQAIAAIDEAAGTKPKEGKVAFRNGSVKVTQPVTGESVDAEQAAAALTAAYLSDDGAAEIPLVEVDPDIDEADVRAAVDGFANPAVSGPIALKFGKSEVTLAPAEFTKAITLEADNGELTPVVNYRRLDKFIDGKVSSGGAPVDATVRLVDGQPKVIPAKPGVTYDPASVEEAFLDLVVAPEGKRTAKVKSTVAEPDFTTKDAKALKIREQVSTFTTYYPYAEYRNVNIGRAAVLVNGTVLKPGETFSLNDVVGERTRENGFTEGFIISNGIFKEDLGGGVSQMATTAFNAMFFAGLKDIEHKPHSFYIDRYPVGREATVAWGAVDLRFQNDTPYGVLVEASVTPATPSSSGVVTVSMWSTKYWDITTSTSKRYNFTDPDTRTLRTEDCYPNTGYRGFEIDVKRFFRKPGKSELVRTQNFHTTYTPSDTVVCKPPKSNGG